MTSHKWWTEWILSLSPFRWLARTNETVQWEQSLQVPKCHTDIRKGNLFQHSGWEGRVGRPYRNTGEHLCTNAPGVISSLQSKDERGKINSKGEWGVLKLVKLFKRFLMKGKWTKAPSLATKSSVISFNRERTQHSCSAVVLRGLRTLPPSCDDHWHKLHPQYPWGLGTTNQGAWRSLLVSVITAFMWYTGTRRQNIHANTSKDKNVREHFMVLPPPVVFQELSLKKQKAFSATLHF